MRSWHPIVDYLVLLARSWRPHSQDRGASAVEWAIITFILAGIAVGIGFTIQSAITAKAHQIQATMNSYQ